MKIIVLGKNGMLGRYVYTYLKNKFDVVGTTRDSIDALKLKKGDLHSLNLEPRDVVINCIGLIPQRGVTRKLDFVATNTTFPLLLQEKCSKHGAKLIHVTTDCVFSGLGGNYNELDIHDATDVYGKSKSLGEPEEATIIRTSIIGEELDNKLSLLEWVRSNADKTTNGFINHYWNGITCLQFAKLCEYIISNNMFWKGTKHVFSPTSVSKYELVKMISEEFKLNVEVKAHKTPKKCDKTLSTVRTDIIIEVPSLRQQVKELVDYSFNSKIIK